MTDGNADRSRGLARLAAEKIAAIIAIRLDRRRRYLGSECGQDSYLC
jgi:hypothetical protein